MHSPQGRRTLLPAMLKTNVYIDGRGEDPEHVADLAVAFCMDGLGVTDTAGA